MEPGTGEGVSVSERDKDKSEWFEAARRALEAQPEGKDQKLLASKMAILEKLPPTIVEELHAFLYVSGDHNVSLTRTDVSLLKAELFERLVAAQFFRDPSESDLVFNSKVSEELLGLAHNPHRFGLSHELELSQNPDLMAIGVTPHGELEVRAVAEIKSFREASGSPKKNLIRQLGRGGFKKTLHSVARVINTHGEEYLREHGLVNILERGGKVKVSRDLNQMVFIPKDTELGLPSDVRVQVKRSDFNYKEVWALGNVFAGLIDRRISEDKYTAGKREQGVDGKEN